jgi:hypothetical protein
MFIPRWALGEYLPEHKTGAILDLSCIKLGKTFYINYDPGDDSDDYEILYSPFKLRTKNDLKKFMELLIKNNKQNSTS